MKLTLPTQHVLYFEIVALGTLAGAGGGVDHWPQPDYPLQEASFLVHVLSDPALRCLGPREPDLSRGAIAFAPAMGFAAGHDTRRLRVL
jgi:hypothetical protein